MPQEAFRYGWGSASRISGTAQLQTISDEILPGEPVYQPVVPFLPPSITTGTGLSTGGLVSAVAEDPEWKQYPDRLDLYCYQGDDVQIPLYFQDPANPTLDMSGPEWAWKSQVRVYHYYNATSVTDFVISASYIAPDPEITDDLGATLISLYLPRYDNEHAGVFTWDLQSTGPFVGPAYPKPPDVADENWPLTTQVKTWLYGRLYVVPRVTTTDYLPPPENALPPHTAVVVTPAGWVVGPNGRVP